MTPTPQATPISRADSSEQQSSPAGSYLCVRTLHEALEHLSHCQHASLGPVCTLQHGMTSMRR